MEKFKLSIVVPSFNVETYLLECVSSLRASTYSNREIILVNDGSTDNTPELCDQLADKFSDVRVIHQENRGLGPARNTGVAASEGDLLAFVDSDDTVPAEAYAVMAQSLRESGSSFVVGGVERFNSKSNWQPWFVEEVHSIRRPRSNALVFPPLVWNVFAWSKMYRREAFDSVVGSFPRGLYEDQVMSAKIFTSAEPVDIVPDIVYNWRAREDNSSITQNKTSTFDLRERLNVAFEVADVIDNAGNLSLSEYWYRKLLSEDLWWYFRVAPNSTLEFWEVLRTSVITLIDRAPATSYWGSAAKRRDLLTLLVKDDRDGFISRLSKA